MKGLTQKELTKIIGISTSELGMIEQGRRNPRHIYLEMLADELDTTSKDCGRPFTLGEGEVQWYEAKGWPLPKRCKECRKKRREARRHGQDPAGNNG